MEWHSTNISYKLLGIILLKEVVAALCIILEYYEGGKKYVNASRKR